MGADIVAGIASRMGFAPEDAATLVRLVRHHLLLAETATRRDQSDPATVDAVSAVTATSAALKLFNMRFSSPRSDAAGMPQCCPVCLVRPDCTGNQPRPGETVSPQILKKFNVPLASLAMVLLTVER